MPTDKQKEQIDRAVFAGEADSKQILELLYNRIGVHDSSTADYFENIQVLKGLMGAMIYPVAAIVNADKAAGLELIKVSFNSVIADYEAFLKWKQTK